MIYNFEDLKNNQNVLIINDLQIEENIKKNTKYIDYTTKNKEDINDYELQNYCNYKNFKSRFIKQKNDRYCYILFCKFFRRYKQNNINLEYNKIMERLNIKKDKRRVKNILQTNYIDNLYNLFTLIKNQK